MPESVFDSVSRWWMLLLLSFSVLAGSPAVASIDVYEFESESQRTQYRALIRELRCPKCQNQDIADSNAPIAQDMRAAVHRLIQDGRSHDEIVAHMVERFGEFVSYKPKVSSETYLLWYGPWVLLGAGLLVIGMLGRRRAAARSSAMKEGLTDDEQEKLQNLLSRHDPSSKDSNRS